MGSPARALFGACLTIALATPVSARPMAADGACRDGLSGGSPPVELGHIFCGEINRRGEATGFHSRPGGVDPLTVSGIGAPDPVRGHPGIYNLYRFTISRDGQSAIKGNSTLYPDKCSADDVIAAVQNAYNNGEHRGPKYSGMSGPGCTDDRGQEFPITGFIDTRRGPRGLDRDGVRIRTGYPDVRGTR